jgi:hypothetical protein
MNSSTRSEQKSPRSAAGVEARPLLPFVWHTIWNCADRIAEFEPGLNLNGSIDGAARTMAHGLQFDVSRSTRTSKEALVQTDTTGVPLSCRFAIDYSTQNNHCNPN